MEAALHDVEAPICAFADHTIDEPVFFAHAPRPPAGAASFERFRLTDAFEGVSTDVFDQRVDTFNDGTIRVLPV